MPNSGVCEAPGRDEQQRSAVTVHQLPAATRPFLDKLVRLQLLSGAPAERFLTQAQDRLGEYSTPERLGGALVQAGLLTEYQLDRALAGTTHGLILGNHRVLSRLGSGSMGVVFLAEHMLMRRRAAVKVLPVDEDCPAAILERFYSEMRVLADLHHPNIVLAYDAGHLPGAGPGMPALLYLVMELIAGGDLEQHVLMRGPVSSVPQACEWIRQAACGLQEAHDHHLVHRDVKPSNLLLTDQGQIKLVDFGLARQFCSRLTDPRALLGTLEYMAPEQSFDPSAVGAPADIYGLGATLFGLLTGETPYPSARSVAEALRLLQHGEPRRLRTMRPDAPAELDALLDQMLQRDPGKRPALPITIMNALLPFTTSTKRASLEVVRQQESAENNGAPAGATVRGSVEPITLARFDRPPRVLLVDDESSVRNLARAILQPLGYACEEAADAESAFEALKHQPYDLVLLDLNLPDMDGYEICRRLREHPVQPHLKIIIVSGRGDKNQLAEALPLGADDYIAKPFGAREVIARVQHALRLKFAQDQADSLAQQLASTNRQLENSLTARSNDVRRAQDALLFAMAKMAESRDGETSDHLRRLQHYARCLAEQVSDAPNWAGVINATFLEQMERCVPLHDIGKMGLPEAVLLKPGKLNSEERLLMETHTLIGDRILETLGNEHGQSLSFLGMASAIVRHHHERYDGTGYPDRLCGEEIPCAARLLALADVYDALRRRRQHKPALSHAEAVNILLEASPGQFDPYVVKAFAARQQDFERIYREIHT